MENNFRDKSSAKIGEAYRGELSMNSQMGKKFSVQNYGEHPMIHNASEYLGISPLVIPEVLEKIMSFLPRNKDLTLCRQVSKNWIGEATKEIISKRYLYISTQQNREDFEGFQQFLKTSGFIQSTRLNIKILRQNKWSSFDRVAFQDFLLENGPRLTHLVVDHSRRSIVDGFFIPDFVTANTRDMILRYLENIEFLDLKVAAEFIISNASEVLKTKTWVNLKTINLQISPFGACNRVDDLGFTQQLFQNAPNLETVTLAPLKENTFDWIVGLALSHILEILCRVELVRLKTLILEFEVSDMCIDHILNANFQLESLYIRNWRSFEIDFSLAKENRIESPLINEHGLMVLEIPGDYLINHLKSVVADKEGCFRRFKYDVAVQPGFKSNMTCLHFLHAFKSEFLEQLQKLTFERLGNGEVQEQEFQFPPIHQL